MMFKIEQNIRNKKKLKKKRLKLMKLKAIRILIAFNKKNIIKIIKQKGK